MFRYVAGNAQYYAQSASSKNATPSDHHIKEVTRQRSSVQQSYFFSNSFHQTILYPQPRSYGGVGIEEDQIRNARTGLKNNDQKYKNGRLYKKNTTSFNALLLMSI